MNTDFHGFDHAHLLGERAMHPIAPCWPRHAALFVVAGSSEAASSALQGARRPESGAARAVQTCAGTSGAAALALAWHAHHGTLGRIQLPFLG